MDAVQLTSFDRLRFYSRIAISAVVFFLIVSVASNIFLLWTRPYVAPASRPDPVPITESLLLVPQAFGRIERGFTVRPQSTSGTAAILPVTGYELPDGLIVPLRDTLLLYRDQGIQFDADHSERLFKDLGISLPIEKVGPLALSEKWRSADRTMEFTLDVERRSLTVTVLGSFGPSPEGRADDAVAIQIARQFIRSIGMDRAAGVPRIVEKVSEGGATKTYVVWAMGFAGMPLIDLSGQAVPGVQVQVGRLSRRALSATFTLLAPDGLSRTAYPRATSEELTKGLLSGGLLPAPKGSKSGLPARFLATQQVGVLVPADREHPAYIVPALLAVWQQPACKGCGSMLVFTFVPAISDKSFQWYAAPKSVMEPLSSSASSSSKK